MPLPNEYSSVSDIELMPAFKNGDVGCFEKLMDRYEKKMINFFYRSTGNQGEAEDLAQELFIKIYYSRLNYEPKAKFSTWLYTIASNLCIDYQRKIKRKPNPVSLDKPVDTDEGEIKREISGSKEELPDNLLDKKYVNETIKHAILSLPPDQKIALSLKVYENKPYDEISKIMGRSVSSIKLLIFRARHNLKKKLPKLWADEKFITPDYTD